jgi:hypothetical protein
MWRRVIPSRNALQWSAGRDASFPQGKANLIAPVSLLMVTLPLVNCHNFLNRGCDRQDLVSVAA